MQALHEALDKADFSDPAAGTYTIRSPPLPSAVEVLFPTQAMDLREWGQVGCVSARVSSACAHESVPVNGDHEHLLSGHPSTCNATVLLPAFAFARRDGALCMRAQGCMFSVGCV